MLTLFMSVYSYVLYETTIFDFELSCTPVSLLLPNAVFIISSSDDL